MAEYVSMKQVPGGTVTAVDDRILNDINLSNGKIYGCDVAYIGNNMIHINAGYGIIKGGLFEIEDHTEYVEYAESEPTTGQIYLKFDASATDKLVIVKETTADLHVLVQNEDANFESGVYEIPICSFVATTTALENVVETWPTASGAMETLATMEALMANTTPGKVADALLTKQINTNLVAKLPSDIDGFSVGVDGKPYITYKVGADTVTKKLGNSYNFIGEGTIVYDNGEVNGYNVSTNGSGACGKNTNSFWIGAGNVGNGNVWFTKPFIRGDATKLHIIQSVSSGSNITNFYVRIGSNQNGTDIRNQNIISHDTDFVIDLSSYSDCRSLWLSWSCRVDQGNNYRVTINKVYLE